MLGAGRKSNKFNLASEPKARTRHAAGFSPACSTGDILCRGGHGTSRQLPTTLFMHWRAISAHKEALYGAACAQYIPSHHAKGIAGFAPFVVVRGGRIPEKSVFFCARSTFIKTHSSVDKSRPYFQCAAEMHEK